VGERVPGERVAEGVVVQRLYCCVAECRGAFATCICDLHLLPLLQLACCGSGCPCCSGVLCPLLPCYSWRAVPRCP
jgi:hypothetical protein